MKILNVGSISDKSIADAVRYIITRLQRFMARACQELVLWTVDDDREVREKESKDKLQLLTGLNQGRVFNSSRGCMYVMHLCFCVAKWPNLKLKAQPKQLLGSLPLAFKFFEER